MVATFLVGSSHPVVCAYDNCGPYVMSTIYYIHRALLVMNVISPWTRQIEPRSWRISELFTGSTCRVSPQGRQICQTASGTIRA